jgi:hypothetical protein
VFVNCFGLNCGKLNAIRMPPPKNSHNSENKREFADLDKIKDVKTAPIVAQWHTF